MTLDPDGMERLIPSEIRDSGVMGDETVRLHMERYAFALKHLQPGRFLDVACGVGYGSRYLYEEGPRPLVGVGIDISKEAISYARERYGGKGLTFEAYDATSLLGEEGFEPESFHTIVSLETLEHLPDPGSFVEMVRPMLAPWGTWIASVPVTPTLDANPHHLHDFTERGLFQLFKGAELREVGRLEQIQRYSPIGLLARKQMGRARGLRSNLMGWYLHHPAYAVKRIWTLLTEGFRNRYLTVAFRAGRA